jgi:dTDP-4-dehydrorhamnose reductase
MRILVTGVTGQVGSALMHSLRGLGTLIAADRTTVDLAKPAEIPSRLEALRPDVIINPAAYTAVDRAEDERATAFLVNGESPGVIARWAAPRAIPLVHFSTDYVFDGQGTAPWREDDRPNPLGVYGASKLAGERAVREAGGPHLIVRTSWVYAAQGANFLRTVLRLALERQELRIVSDQVGAPTSAACIAKTITKIAEMDHGGLGNSFARADHCINLAGTGETSWHGFATAIVDGLKARGVALKTTSIVPISTEDYPTRAKRPINSRLDLSRLRQTFRIDPPDWRNLLDVELDRLVALLNESAKPS